MLKVASSILSSVQETLQELAISHCNDIHFEFQSQIPE